MRRVEGRGDPDCPRCKGVGLVFVQDPKRHEIRQAVCKCTRDLYQAERAAYLREICGVDDDTLERFTFSTFHPSKCAGERGRKQRIRDTMREVKALCMQYAQNPKGWMVLAGKVGCGKSHLAFAIANGVMDRGVGVVWETVPELMDALRAGYGDGSYTKRLQGLQRVPVLILDDLGTENNTAWVIEKLFQLLNHRYMKALPTVVTTNLDLEDAEVKLSPRIRSRLLDASLSTVVRLPAGDFRVPMGV